MPIKMWSQQLKDCTTLLLQVKISKPKTQIIEERDGVLIIAVKALPIDGKANQEIERFFTRLLKRKAIIIAGNTSKRKRLLLQ